MQDVAPTKAVFLDRDGVINVDHGYVHTVEKFQFIPGIFELARYVHGLGRPLIVVTNQAGIGRGYFTEDDFQAISRWMCERFAAEAAPIARIYHCPYHPEGGIGRYRREHPWRKPRPGMLLQAAADLGLDLPGSVMIGDKLIDMECAAAAGLETRIRFDPNATPAPPGAPAHDLVASLAEALEVLRARLEPEHAA